ncbi:MAG: holo-ACP synthase [Anaerolineaceae bacterium]
MGIGIGVDIIALNRIRDAIETSGDVFLNKIFTKREIERSKSHSCPDAYFAMLFAGKEAIFKLFHIGWETGVKLNEIEIREGPNGEPLPVLTGTFAKIVKEKNVTELVISLSSDTDYAIGVASMK